MKKITNAWNWFKRISLLKKILLVGVVIVAIYLLIPKSDSSAEITYKTGAVAMGSVEEIVSETGEIMSTGKTDVTSTITGVVSEIYVDNGDTVTRGQALFEVTSGATAEDRSRAYSNYLTAKNNLDTAERTKNSNESAMWAAHESFESKSLDTELSVDDPIYIQTNRDWLAAEEKYLDQDAIISQAKAAVSSSWFSYQATIDGKVTAPISATIANLSVSPGQEVTASQNAMVIGSAVETWVKLTVSEASVVTIEPGQLAKVSVDALSTTPFDAVVKRVDEFGTENSGVVTYNIYLVLSEPSSAIRPAMTVQVDITTQSKDNVLVVPNSAIKPYQGSKAVQILSKKTGEPLYMPIEIGIEGESMTEVVFGLELDQEIIISQSSSDSEKKSSVGLFGGAGGK